MKTRLMRGRCRISARAAQGPPACRLSTTATCPAISPAVRLRRMPSLAVKAELAIDGTSYLARDADRSSSAKRRLAWRTLPWQSGPLDLMARGSWQWGLPQPGEVIPALPAIAIRHPHRLHGLPIGHADQVTLGAVDRSWPSARSQANLPTYPSPFERLRGEIQAA